MVKSVMDEENLVKTSVFLYSECITTHNIALTQCSNNNEYRRNGTIIARLKVEVWTKQTNI